MATEKQREKVYAFFEKGEFDIDVIAKKTKVRPLSVRAYKAHWTRDLGEEEKGEAIEAKFSMERDLQKALRDKDKIHQLERGLKITDGGKEKEIAAGRVDITALDSRKRTVVIELKVGTADKASVGQILSYIGALSTGKRKVRGILVARDFDNQAIYAAKAVPNLELKQYTAFFKFKSIR